MARTRNPVCWGFFLFSAVLSFLFLLYVYYTSSVDYERLYVEKYAVWDAARESIQGLCKDAAKVDKLNLYAHCKEARVTWAITPRQATTYEVLKSWKLCGGGLFDCDQAVHHFGDSLGKLLFYACILVGLLLVGCLLGFFRSFRGNYHEYWALPTASAPSYPPPSQWGQELTTKHGKLH